MAGLAEDSMQRPGIGRRLGQAGMVLAGLAVVGLLAWGLKSLIEDKPAPKRQVARIALLPDTPPPPPPPPPKEQPKPVDEAPKPQAADAPKPVDTPAPPSEQLKMEGEAGSGPSAFAAGTVQREYQGGPIATGPAAGGTGVRSDRAQERFYANSARQRLRDELERHLRSDAVELTATFSLWLEPDGDISRFELASGGNPQHDADLRAALDELQRSLRLPQPPDAMTQPLRFRLTVRPLG